MQKVLSLVLTFVMTLHLVPLASAQDTVQSQITAMPPGAHIEVRLKNNQRLRGTKGDVSATGFTLKRAEGDRREIAFDDVLSVKIQQKASSKKTLIIAGVVVAGAVVAVVVTFVVLAKTHKLGPY